MRQKVCDLAKSIGFLLASTVWREKKLVQHRKARYVNDRIMKNAGIENGQIIKDTRKNCQIYKCNFECAKYNVNMRKK